jgi:peroxiredoxin
MPNPLTGDFEAVVQIAVPQIDGLLATLHQAGAAANAPLKLLHSARLRIGHERPRPDLSGLGDWVTTASRDVGAPDGQKFREQLVAAAPAGVSRLLSDAFANLGDLIDITQDPIRGSAAVQISNVRVSFPPGTSSEVALHAQIRATYEPEPLTAVLAAPIHGAVDATFTVRRRVVNGVRRLEIKPSSDDSKIGFSPAPGSGVSAAQASTTAIALRRTLRLGLTLLPVDLPASFPFGDFRAIGAGQSQVVALPLSLSGGAVSGSLDSLGPSFVSGHGFAVAVGADRVRRLIDVEAIRNAIARRSFTVRLSRFGVGVSVTYRLRFTSGPTIAFLPGAIEVAGRVAAETSTWWAPNGFVSFRQRLALVLDASTQIVRLETAGPPSVDESWFIPHSRAVDIVETEIGRAVRTNRPRVEQIFSDTRSRFAGALRRFDPGGVVTYATLDISTDGVIVRGELSGTPRSAPVVRVTERDGGATLSAFESWVPGGSVDRFIWTWVEYPAHLPTVLSGQLGTAVDEQRFLLPRPEGISSLSQVCLRIEGGRVLQSGAIVGVVAGTTCELPEPELELAIPSWWEPLTVPVWPPDLPPDARLPDAVVAHVSVQSDRPGATDPRRNTLVGFVDLASAAEVRWLAGIVAAIGRRRSSLSVLVVLPPGSLTTRREVEARLAPLTGLTLSPAQVTEDVESAWTRTFAVTSRPACFLVNARREVAWSQQGEAPPPEVAAALEGHILPVPGPRRRPLRTPLAAGDAAPDLIADDGRGAAFALHRQRGHAVAMVFWQAWSTPCIEELIRLQALAAGGRTDRAVVGILGSTPVGGLEALVTRLGITVPVVADFEHRLARRYGIRCWPTTVYVDAEGRVERVAFGARQRDRMIVSGRDRGGEA